MTNKFQQPNKKNTSIINYRKLPRSAIKDEVKPEAARTKETTWPRSRTCRVRSEASLHLHQLFMAHSPLPVFSTQKNQIKKAPIPGNAKHFPTGIYTKRVFRWGLSQIYKSAATVLGVMNNGQRNSSRLINTNQHIKTCSVWWWITFSLVFPFFFHWIY